MRLLAVVGQLDGGCGCSDGCPGCVGPAAAPGLGAKRLVGVALDMLCELLPIGGATSMLREPVVVAG
ncbi:MAG: hypothetical protein EXR66_04805 [Dehalococcoidia bacterium]|nr:hypothetical protein [Dehalococcoidia bacterium]